MKRNLLMTSAIGIVLFGASSAAGTSYEVQFKGAQRDVVQRGDLRDNVELAPIVGKKHVYAVGPLSGLTGEITIWDSKVWTAKVVNKTSHPQVALNPKAKAPFLVWAEVTDWQAIPIKEEVASLKELEQWIEKIAREVGIDMSRPFPFRLVGPVAQARYHVLNKRDNTPHNPTVHEQIKVKYELADYDLKLIGFWSDRHQGIFTHHGTNIHVHLLSKDRLQSGHLEDVKISKPVTIFLPRRS